MKSIKHLIAVAAFCGALFGCSGNESTEGIQAHFSMFNLKAKPATDDTSEGTTKQFTRDIDGRQFQLQTGLLNVVPTELVKCSALARIKPLDFLFPAAYAHGADEAPPSGVLDVSQPDGETIALGKIDLLPGEYCGARIQLQAVFGAPVDPHAVDMNGKSLYVNNCYYYKSGTGGEEPAATHYCYTLGVTDSSEAHYIAFDTPVTVDAGHREIEAVLVVHYDRWFERESATDAFSALDGYAAVVENPPCGTPVADAAACTTAKNNFKASLQSNEDLKALLVKNVLNSIEFRNEE